jgi:hypothetical protein
LYLITTGFTTQTWCDFLAWTIVLFWMSLLSTTGRIIRADKVGAISSAQSPILSRLGLSEEQWLTLTTEFEQHFCYAVGAEQMMQAFKTHTHRKRIGGMRQAKRLLS